MKIPGVLAFAAAVLTASVSNCIAEPESIEECVEKPIRFTAGPVETRTEFGTPEGDSYPTLWTGQDSYVKIILNLDPAATNTKDAAVTPSPDFTRASFTATFGNASSYTFYCISPAAAWFNSKASDGYVGITVPDLQTPTATSVDPLAQIMVAKTGTSTARPGQVDFHFSHWTSYGKISLTNLDLGDAVMESVDLVTEAFWSGRWFHYFNGKADAAYAGCKSITVKTTSPTDIWFACAPVDLSGKTLTVKVRTDKGSITKSFTLPSNGRFVSGQIARFSLDMGGATLKKAVVYEQVKALTDLTDGCKVIIAAASDANPYAISKNQGNPTNRPGTYVSKADGRIIDPGDEVETFTVVNGTQAGTYSFITSAGKYIYAANSASSSSIGLKSGDSQTAEGSWYVTLSDGYTKLVSATEASRNTLQCYTYKGVFLFNTYVADATKDYVNLYKCVGYGPEGEDLDPDNFDTLEAYWRADVEQKLSAAFFTKAVSIGSYTMRFAYKVYGSKPADGYPLYISLHGGGSTTAEDNDKQWSNQQVLYKPSLGVYLCPRAIKDSWDMHSVKEADAFYEALIRMTTVFLDVNPDQVYLMGYSAGGDGVWQEGPRMADHWAAASMMAGHPNNVSLLSLRNLPFMVWCGTEDSAYGRNEACAAYIDKLAALHAADPEGYIYEGHMVEGAGHSIPGTAAALPWMAQFTRNPYPTRVVWQQTGVTREYFYWLGIPKSEAKKDKTLIVNLADNVVTIDRCDYTTLRIYLNEKMVDFSRPVTVKKGSTVLFEGTLTPSEETRRSTLAARQDLAYAFPCCVTVTMP